MILAGREVWGGRGFKKGELTHVSESIEGEEEQEEQEASARSEVLDVQMQADVSLRAALLLWRLRHLQINIGAKLISSGGERRAEQLPPSSGGRRE